MSKHIKKLMPENRLVHLMANGKDNLGVRGKIIRKLRKYN